MKGEFINNRFDLTMKLYLAGVLVVFLLVCPNWPWYNRNPLKWLPPLHDSADKKKKSRGEGRKAAAKGAKKDK